MTGLASCAPGKAELAAGVESAVAGATLGSRLGCGALPA